jgi:hypothetical protein
MIGVVALRIEHLAGGAASRNAVAAEIPEVRRERVSRTSMPDHARLDHGAA